MPLGDSNAILAAARYAALAHGNQRRKWTGRLFAEHPARVASRIAIREDASETMVIAALLHDVVEDTSAEIKEIEERFGARVAGLVEELTDHSSESTVPRWKRKASERERLRRVSRKAKIIKLMDRIDNLRDMSGAPESFRRIYAEESLLLAEAIGDADELAKAELVSLANELVG